MSLKKLSVLVADPKLKNRKAAEFQLNKHDVTTVSSFQEAQKELSENTYDVFLSELSFPMSFLAEELKEKGFRSDIERNVGLFLKDQAIQEKIEYIGILTKKINDEDSWFACRMIKEIYGEYKDSGLPNPLSMGHSLVVMSASPKLFNKYRKSKNTNYMRPYDDKAINAYRIRKGYDPDRAEQYKNERDLCGETYGPTSNEYFEKGSRLRAYEMQFPYPELVEAKKWHVMFEELTEQKAYEKPSKRLCL